MEFIINTDLTTALPKTIDFNFEAQKAWLEERLSYYNNLAVTEDTIKDAKADRAQLNKLREAMDTRRKEIKREWMVPYNAFEAKVKELTALIDKPVAAIDGQLANYEEIRREEKRTAIANLYLETVPDTMRDIIPLERIADPKWLNATTSMKKVGEDLATIIKRTETDMMLLDTVEPEYASAVRAAYIRTLDIQAAMQQKKALQAAAEAFRQREEARAAQEAESPAPAAYEPEIAPPAPQPETEQIYTLRLEFQLTKAEADELKWFLTKNNITYRKI